MKNNLKKLIFLISSVFLLGIAAQAHQKSKDDFSAPLILTTTDQKKEPKRSYRFLAKKRIVPTLICVAAVCSLSQTTQGQEIIEATTMAIKGIIGTIFLTTCYGIDCIIGNQPGLGR